MGADVVKVEKLPGGDDARGYAEPRVNGVSAPFLIMNRNKRGIALDLKHPQGRDILLRLVETADVLTENYRRGTLEKFGLGYDVLAKKNPGLIYCAVSGYGRDGPLGDKGGFDLIAQGFAGLMSITGEPGRPPVKTGNPVADINAGILAVGGIVAAYVHKLRTGQGQLVDTSLMEAALQQTYWQAAIYFATGESPGPTGSAHVLTAPYQAFRAGDGWINRPTGSASPKCSVIVSGVPIRASRPIRQGWKISTRCSRSWMQCFSRAARPSGSPLSTPPACPRVRCTAWAKR
jgi:crotonobetainyl-CoA:carnitine CoA-transferase CaiB-like acyl-CoA transferase